MPMWRRLELAWGPERDVREYQPLTALKCTRTSRSIPQCVKFGQRNAGCLPSVAIDMFVGEMGVDPRLGDGGRGYRRRVASLIAAGRAWDRFE